MAKYTKWIIVAVVAVVAVAIVAIAWAGYRNTLATGKNPLKST